jgi:hypothetical protein
VSISPILSCRRRFVDSTVTSFVSFPCLFTYLRPPPSIRALRLSVVFVSSTHIANYSSASPLFTITPLPCRIQPTDLIRPNSIKFCIDSKHSCPTTSTRAFIDHVVDALRDIRDICLWARKREEEASLTCSSSEVTISEGKSAEQAVTGNSRCKSGHVEGSIIAKARL